MPKKLTVRYLHLDRPALLKLVAQLAELLDETDSYAESLPFGWDATWSENVDCKALSKRISRALKKAQRATAPKPKKARRS